jgi:arylsulfatase A-like enzyme
MKRFVSKLILSIFLPFLANANERPNILFISIDDLNDWVGPLSGHPQAKTPNMDRLAKMGMLFTNAHSPGMTCNVSRTALLTGLRPSTTGVYGNPTDWRKVEKLKGVTSLPRHFKESGYQTFGAGKLFHASTWNMWAYFGYNDTTAWNAYFPSLNRQVPDEVWPHDVPVNGPIVKTFDWSPVATTEMAMGDGQVTTWSVEQILANGTEPRFNAVGIYRPHLPWYLPRKYFEMHPLEGITLPPVRANDLSDLPESVSKQYENPRATSTAGRFKWVSEDPENNRWKQIVQAYLASVSFADAMLGHVLDALDQSGRAQNTIIVLWSDHGFHVGEKKRVGKGTLWRESTRVPLIVVAPGVTQPGSRSSTAVSLMDLYPTLVDLADLETPSHLEGTSLVPILKDASKRSNRAALSTSSFGNHAVSGNNYRYLKYQDGSEELYDIVNDPHEWTNLAGNPRHTETIAELARWLPKHDEPDIGSNRSADEMVKQISDITLP